MDEEARYRADGNGPSAASPMAEGASEPDGLPAALVWCVALGAVVVVLAMPALAMMEGGYTWTDGLFFKRQVHAVARTGGGVSGTLFAIGSIGMVAGLVWPRLSLWIGAATRLRVLAVYGGVIVLALACRVETTALLKMVHAREDRAVRALYEQSGRDMTVASVQALAATLDRDIQARPADMGSYAGMLDAERGGAPVCTMEFSAPERQAGVRMVARLASCGSGTAARIERIYLLERKQQVAAK